MNVGQLNLEEVKALLEQGGRPVPDAAQLNDTAFVQGLLDALCDLSSRDALTGALNRRSMMTQIRKELDRVARAGDHALLLMVDIDHFKRINDQYGHLAGDAVIRSVGHLLRECARPMDSVARFGGEEFAVIFPNCPPAFAHVVGERIRARVEGLEIPYQVQVSLHVTVSCGGAFALAGRKTLPEDWIDRADHQMYRAKSSGRNRVCLESPPGGGVSAEEKGLLFRLTSSEPGMMGASVSADPKSIKS